MTKTIPHCWSCGEHHAKSVMCPAHEMRTTGQAWAKAHKECERRKPDRAPWGKCCPGCYFENPEHGTGPARSCDARRIDGRAVHVWAPDIPTSPECKGVPDRREPKREHVARGPDRRFADATRPEPGQDRCKRGAPSQ